MTEKLYDLNSYVKDFTATVLSCEPYKNGFKIILDKTAFFPEGGGQGADCGVIGDAKVHDVQIEGGDIVHFADKPAEIGYEVKCSIDWERRFRHMQNHSGEHIVSGIIHRLFRFDNVGFHLGHDDVTLDLNGTMTKDSIEKVELLANKAVYENAAITAEYPNDENLKQIDYRCKGEIDGPVRIVTISGYDICACCAPHVKSTGEIGIIKLLSFERYKGGTRIHLKCGLDALLDYNKRCLNDYKISCLLKAKQTETAEAVEALHEKQAELKALCTDIKNKYTDLLVKSAESDGDVLIILDKIFGTDDMRRTVNSLMEGRSGICAAFSGDDDNGYTYVLGSTTEELPEFTKSLNTALNGRGGGRGTMVFGSVASKKQEIEKFFRQVKSIG